MTHRDRKISNFDSLRALLLMAAARKIWYAMKMDIQAISSGFGVNQFFQGHARKYSGNCPVKKKKNTQASNGRQILRQISSQKNAQASNGREMPRPRPVTDGKYSGKYPILKMPRPVTDGKCPFQNEKYPESTKGNPFRENERQVGGWARVTNLLSNYEKKLVLSKNFIFFLSNHMI